MAVPERDGVLTVQNTYLAYHLVRRNLSRAKVHVNGHLKYDIDSKLSHPAIEGERFKKAVQTLETANDAFMDRHKDNVMQLVLNLDISDSQLHAEFLKAAGQVVDEIRWGRISSLFFLTSLLAERLVNEGHGNKVESLVMWLAQFLNDHVSHWIETRGGWAAITDALSPDTVTSKVPAKTAPKAAEVKGSWLTIAAIGVGALLVGTLAMK